MGSADTSEPVAGSYEPAHGWTEKDDAHRVCMMLLRFRDASPSTGWFYLRPPCPRTVQGNAIMTAPTMPQTSIDNGSTGRCISRAPIQPSRNTSPLLVQYRWLSHFSIWSVFDLLY